MNHSHEPTPKERLSVSRNALIKYMKHEENSEPPASSGASHDGMEGFGEPPGESMWSTVKHTAKVWWQHHPAHLALNLAEPALSRYAEKKPLQLLGIAAGVGAAAVVIRPWRLVSVTGLLFAAIKASDAPVLLMSILSSRQRTTTKKNDG